MKYFVFVGFFRRSMCRYISILTREFGFISGDSASSVVKLTNAVKKELKRNETHFMLQFKLISCELLM